MKKRALGTRAPLRILVVEAAAGAARIRMCGDCPQVLAIVLYVLFFSQGTFSMLSWLESLCFVSLGEAFQAGDLFTREGCG